MTNKQVKEEVNNIPLGAIRKLAHDFLLKNVLFPDPDKCPDIMRAIEGQLRKSEARKELLLPNLSYNNQTISIFSDYGGGSPEALYETYTFLFAAYDHLSLFKNRMPDIRRNYGLEQPWAEISFKGLHHGPVHRALKDYLIAANNLIPGLLLTVIVDKKVHSLLGPNTKQSLDEINKLLEGQGFGRWKKQVAERLLRIIHVIAYFCALLSVNEQKVLWVTDDDDIVANAKKINSTLSILNNTLHHYASHTYDVIRAIVPSTFDKSQTKNDLLDVLSLTDLVAGAIEHFYTKRDKMEPVEIKEDADRILVWHTEQGVLLKKIAIIIRLGPDHGCETATVKFGLNKDVGQDYFDFQVVHTSV